MSQDNRIDMSCTVCKRITHQTTKNKKNTPARLELMKFCKFCKQMTSHKEDK